ncbi:hypothetical protein HGRIS_000041 [Hohenbuehelia grisea]|uniref:Uncharacterized protein n=1 Tax=Hohenbuehelia grisea TaxID=104357 RepID=A0ABR3JR72_9AGAR
MSTINPAGVRRVQISCPAVCVSFLMKINGINNEEVEAIVRVNVSRPQDILGILNGLLCSHTNALQDLTVSLERPVFLHLGPSLLRLVVNTPGIWIFLQRFYLKGLKISRRDLVKALASFKHLGHCSLDDVTYPKTGLQSAVEPLANTLSSLAINGQLQSRLIEDPQTLVNDFGHVLVSQDPPLPIQHLELRSCDESILPFLRVNHQDLNALTVDLNDQSSAGNANLQGTDAGHALRLSPLKTIRVLNLNVACFNEVINFFSAMHIQHDQGHMHTREIQVDVKPSMLQAVHKSLWLKLDAELNRFANASIIIGVEMGGIHELVQVQDLLLYCYRTREVDLILKQ